MKAKKVSNDGIPANLFRRYRAFTRGGAKIGGRFTCPKIPPKIGRLFLHQPSSLGQLLQKPQLR